MSGANKLAILAARKGVTVEALVREALAKADGSIPKAAHELQISRQGLHQHLNNERRQRVVTANEGR